MDPGARASKSRRWHRSRAATAGGGPSSGRGVSSTGVGAGFGAFIAFQSSTGTRAAGVQPFGQARRRALIEPGAFRRVHLLRRFIRIDRLIRVARRLHPHAPHLRALFEQLVVGHRRRRGDRVDVHALDVGRTRAVGVRARHGELQIDGHPCALGVDRPGGRGSLTSGGSGGPFLPQPARSSTATTSGQREAV